MLPVLLFVKAEDRLRTADENGTFDEIGLLQHQLDRLLLRFRQWTRLEHRAAPADEFEKVLLVDVALEKRAIRWIPVDIALFDADALLLQITSGVAAGRSGGLPVEDRLGHTGIVQP